MITSLQSGKYRIESSLGSGGFGNTYLAEQITLGRKVAIKEFFMKEFCGRDDNTSHVIIPTEGSKLIVDKYRQKFLKEAQVIASLKNEHIIQIHDIFEENGTAYYVMEYVDGGSLKDKVESEGALSEIDAINYICQVGDALSYLHSNNILHLDVKPANILLDNSNRAILIDFGISKHYDEVGGQTSTTPAGISKGYAPLEQYKQDAITQFNPTTDVYSLGASLYFLLTGKNPPDATDIYEDGLPTMPISITEATRQAIIAAMQPRRKDRPQSISDFINMINLPIGQSRQVNSSEVKVAKDIQNDSTEETLIFQVGNEGANLENNGPKDIGSSQRQYSTDIKHDEETVIIQAKDASGKLSNDNSGADHLGQSPNRTAAKSKDEKKPKSKLGILISAIAVIVVAIICVLPKGTDTTEKVQDVSNVKNETTSMSNVSKVKAPKLVDMGVSVLWADRNVGATKIYDYGLNYNWGVTDITGSEKAPKQLDQFPSNISGTNHDIASVNYGEGWRMPTLDDFKELANNSEIYTYSEAGVSGYLLVSKTNGNKLFIPNYRRYEIQGDSTSDVFTSDSYPIYWTSNCIKSYNGGFVYCFNDRKDAYRPSFYLPIRAVKQK